MLYSVKTFLGCVLPATSIGSSSVLLSFTWMFGSSNTVLLFSRSEKSSDSTKKWDPIEIIT